jgi:hypothetical protein
MENKILPGPIDGLQLNTVYPSPVDFRDKPAEAVISPILGETPIPSEYDTPDTTQKDQGSKPKCVGCGSTSVKESKELEEGNKLEFDDDWMYDQCKQIDGIPNFPGTYLRTAMLVLKNIGCLPKGGDPNDSKLIAKYRIAGFVRVEPTPDAIKRAIYTLGPVLVGFRGTNQGWMTGMIRAPKTGEEIWGHAVKERGYVIEWIKGQNSWGKGWGINGGFQDPLDYMPFEAWAVIKDLPDNWQDINPVGEKPAYFFANNLGPSQVLNPETKILQECLIYLGCLHREDIGANLGYFGPKTTEGVKIYQKRYKIPATGFVGPLTRADINKRFPAPY